MKLFLHRSAAAAVAITILASGPPVIADEVCDEFPDVHAKWALRTPKCDVGVTTSTTDRDGYLRFYAPPGSAIGPDGINMIGDFDNWAGFDRAPRIERTDMGAGDWTITTRLEFDGGWPTAVNYHVGLMVRFGAVASNQILYWGMYTGNDVLDIAAPQVVAERVGSRLGVPYPPDALDPAYVGPVSLQIEKAGTVYTFRHRTDDGLDWTEDLTIDTAAAGSALNYTDPVTSVGLIIKTYGGTASPEIIADFDYFCLEVPDVTLPKDVVTDPIPVIAPISGLGCVKNENGTLDLTWSVCSESTTDTVVRIAGDVVKTLTPDVTSVTLDPPFPGGSIMSISVDNGFGRPMSCTIVPVLFEVCDEFDDPDPLAGEWNFRVPVAGPTVSTTDNPGSLRFVTPGTRAFDSWSWATGPTDQSPTLERYDMGESDWEISTRLSYADGIAPSNAYHVGLMAGWGMGTMAGEDGWNDIVYWGDYNAFGNLKAERSGIWSIGAGGAALNTTYPGTPVSLRLQKVGNQLVFSHRQDDAVDPWTIDFTYTILQPSGAPGTASPPAGTPISRVGLIIKTWGNIQVNADFEYFCLKVLDSPPQAKFTATPTVGIAPLEVTLSAAGSKDPSGGTLTYAWDFGDGQTGTGENVKHTFIAGGLYTVTLTATDDEKNEGKATGVLYISDDPSPFTFQRVGAKGMDGLVEVEGPASYCMEAGGSNISITADNFHFLEKTLTGDFIVGAKITSGDFSGSARAGLMARLKTDENSTNVLMSIYGAKDGYLFQYRLKTSLTTASKTVVDPPRGPLPAWIRLERQGAFFIGYYSTDGSTFTEHTRFEIPNLNVADLLVGFAATSGNEAATENICFELSGFGAVPAKPAKPTGLAATAGDGKVTLDWSDNSEGDLQGYNVYRSAAGGAFVKANTEIVASSAYQDTGLTNGTEYCYKVRAVNPAGESVDSDQACATPKAVVGVTFKRGNGDGAGTIDLTDAIFVLQFLFMGGTKPPCLDAADADDSGALDLTDAIFVLQFLFMGGTAPLAPGPTTCGPDPTTNDLLDCLSFLGCP